VKIIFSKKCLSYGIGHVESPTRVETAFKLLQTEGYEFQSPTSCSEEDILAVHSIEYIRLLQREMIRDPDTPAYKGIYEIARLASGAAIMAAKVKGFSLMRPPGHHAGRNGLALGVPTQGFCYLNNIAIAVKWLGKSTVILDIDGHHGNGTQEIFMGDKNVTYLSLHRYPHYPGTGYLSQSNCFNFPLPADCGDAKYLETLEQALNTIANWDKIEVVAVSAGFDTHSDDLASLSLTRNAYRAIGKQLAHLNKPTFFVLEGGYSGENMGADINELLQGFGG